jgi:hypothetical protein
MGIAIEPKLVSFDMNGTLIHYRQDETIRRVVGERLPRELRAAPAGVLRPHRRPRPRRQLTRELNR